MAEIDRIQNLIRDFSDQHSRNTEKRKLSHQTHRLNPLRTHFDVIQVRRELFDHNTRKLNVIYVFVWS